MNTSSESSKGGTGTGNTVNTSTLNQEKSNVMSSATSDEAATAEASGPSESTPTKAGGSNTTPPAPLKIPLPSDNDGEMLDGSFLPRYETPPPLFKDPNGYFSDEETPPPTEKVGPPKLVRSNSVFASGSGGITPVILFPGESLLARSSSASDDDDLPLGEKPVLKRGVTSPF
jgi:hypothetical protein